MRAWFRGLPRARFGRRPTRRPTLECLEGRELPSTSAGLHVATGPTVNNSSLNATAALSATDIWAVGGSYDTQAGTSEPFAEHFNGTAWRVVPTAPLPAGTAGPFNGVAAVASNNVWAVGQGASPFIEHFDGTRWRVVPSPTGAGGSTLQGVAALADGTVVAVGLIEDANNNGHGLILQS